MKFIYLILAHKNPEQLHDLVDTLQDENNYFVIHVDNKTDIKPFLHLASENVFFCKKRINVTWGGFSQILATIELIKTFKSIGLQPDYIHLLSGQDFPIKDNKTIQAYFKKNKGRNFIKVSSLPYSNWTGNKGMDRITYKWLIDETGWNRARELVDIQRQRNMTRKYPDDYKPFGGSQWWSLTCECMDYIIAESVPGNVLFDFYRNTYIPDEMYFQTLLMNSSLKETLTMTHNLRYIDWHTGPECPRILRMSDYETLKQSDALFARKFDDTINSQIRNSIRKLLI